MAGEEAYHGSTHPYSFKGNGTANEIRSADNDVSRPDPNFAGIPALRPDSRTNSEYHNSMSSAKRGRSVSPARSMGVPLVRQSGSPERRLRIQELESRLQKPKLLVLPRQNPLNTDKQPHSVGNGLSSIRLASSLPERSYKKTRFADLGPEESKETTNTEPSASSLSDSLERISNTLTSTAVSLRDVKDTQRTILAEIQLLKAAVDELKEQGKAR